MEYLSEDEVKIAIKRTFDKLNTILKRVIDDEIKKILVAKKQETLKNQLSFI